MDMRYVGVYNTGPFSAHQTPIYTAWVLGGSCVVGCWV